MSPGTWSLLRRCSERDGELVSLAFGEAADRLRRRDPAAARSSLLTSRPALRDRERRSATSPSARNAAGPPHDIDRAAALPLRPRLLRRREPRFAGSMLANRVRGTGNRSDKQPNRRLGGSRRPPFWATRRYASGLATANKAARTMNAPASFGRRVGTSFPDLPSRPTAFPTNRRRSRSARAARTLGGRRAGLGPATRAPRPPRPSD